MMNTTTQSELAALKARHAEAMTRANAAQAAHDALNAAFSNCRMSEEDSAALAALRLAVAVAIGEAQELSAQMDEVLYGRRAGLEDR